MNATTNMTMPMMTAGGGAAQLLALLGGQGTGGQPAGAAQGGGDGGFAVLMQALANGNGNSGSMPPTAGAPAAPGKPAPSLAALLSLYKDGEAPAGDAAPGGDPLKALMASLKAAGIDVTTLSRPAAAPASPQGQTEDGTDGTDNPMLALLALLTAPGAPAPAMLTGQAAGDGSTGTVNPPQSSSMPAGQPAPANQTAENILAALNPADRARLVEALRQLQATSAGTPISTAAVSGKTGPASQAPASQTDAGGPVDKTGPSQPGTVANPPGTPLPQPAAQTNGQGQAQTQPPARAPLPEPMPQGQTPAQTQTQAQAQAQPQPQARTAHTVPPGGTATADTAARAISDALAGHMGRDVAVQVTRPAPSTAMSGGPHLLSAGTSAGAMAAAQGQPPVPGQGQSNGFAQAVNASVQRGGPSGGARPAGGETTARLSGLAANTLPAMPSGDAPADGFTDLLNPMGRPGGLDQLSSSVASMSRAPMAHQPAPAQVALHMGRAAEAGGNRFVIQLSPAFLGDVRVDMKVGKDGSVHAMLHVEKPETLQMLQRDAGLLHQALQDAGLKPDSGSLNFSLRQDGGQFAGQDGHRPAASHGGVSGSGETDSIMDMAAAQPARRGHAGHLDVTI